MMEAWESALVPDTREGRMAMVRQHQSKQWEPVGMSESQWELLGASGKKWELLGASGNQWKQV